MSPVKKPATSQPEYRKSGRSKKLNPYITDELYKKVRVYCARKGLSISGFTETAFEEYFHNDFDSESVLKKMDRYFHRMESMDSNLNIMSEAFALFLQFWFAHTPEIAQDDKKEASFNGKARYSAFIQYLGEQMINGRRFADEFVVPVANNEELKQAARNESDND